MKSSLYFKLLAFVPAILILLTGCTSGVRKDFSEELKKANEQFDFPLPKWDQEFEGLRSEYKKKYKAEEVKFTRPYFYASQDDYSYWLKVAFLNPDLKNKTVKEFGKEVAMSTLQHLTNPDDFEKIEIAVTQKTGFIITFSKNENAFFYLDSLRIN